MGLIELCRPFPTSFSHFSGCSVHCAPSYAATVAAARAAALAHCARYLASAMLVALSISSPKNFRRLVSVATGFFGGIHLSF